MNVKKTALATAIALTVGGGSAWAATTTVKSQFILDKDKVNGGETVNLALLGLNKDGEVDRFGESNGSVIMAVLNTIKGKIQCGSDSPGATPKDTDPAGGYFASEVKYARLQQGVGRCSIYYPNEIVGEAETTDTVTVYLQERIPTGEGGVRFERIGEAVDKTITIKAGISVPAALTFTSFEPAPADPIVKDKIDRGTDGLKAKMTAGFEGAQLRVRGVDQNALRAANIIKLEVIDNTRSDDAKVIYSDTQRMIRDEALFTLTSEITEAGTYDMIASLEGETGIDSLTMVSRDTLTVLPTMRPGGLKIHTDKARITKPAAGACQAGFPHEQVCQGAIIGLNLVDEYKNDMGMWDEHGNPTTSTDLQTDLIVSFTDANKVVSDTALKFKIPAGKSWGMPESGDKYLGNQDFETLKAGTTSLVAKVVSGGSGIEQSNALAIKVVDKSLVAEKAADFDGPQKAGTEFKAFKVRVSNNAGGIENTTNPGAIVIESWDKEQVTVNRNPETFIVEGYFEKVTGDMYLISDQAGNYGQVWVMGESIAPGAANSVTLLNPIGEEITSINPTFDKEPKQYVTSIPEAAFQMVDAYDNVITEARGDFHVSSSAAKTITYVGTAGGSHGEPGRSPGGVVNVIYDTVGTKAFAGEDTITVTFNKPALSNKTFTVKTMIPAAVEEGLESITSYIETNDIPVNSEVALKVETLDKQGNLFAHDNMVVTVTFNEGIEETDGSEEGGEAVEVITPTVYELIGYPLTAAQCINAGGQFVDGKCDITPEDCLASLAKDYIFTEAQGCLEQEEKIVASGGRLTFKTGRKLFVVEAGPRDGKFSLTFKDANNPDIKDTRLFNVTKEIVAPVEDTEEGCIGDGNFWMADDKVCKPMPELTTNGAFVIKANGKSGTSDARITGGASINGGDFTGGTAILSDASEIQFVGNVKFDPDHEGQKVDIIAVALYQPNPLLGGVGPGTYFSLLEGGGVAWWEDLTNPGDIEPFYDEKHTIVKDEPKVVEIYNGTFDDSTFVPSTINVWLGYRLTSGSQKGTIIFNPESINVTLRP